MTDTTVDPSEPKVAGRSGARRIRPPRGLPGGRAVVGALLVTAAAVGVFSAHLRATAEPATRYLVAGQTIEPGTQFASEQELLAALTSTAIDLVPEVAARAVEVEDAGGLVGRVVVSPLEFGDLLSWSAFGADRAVQGSRTMSFAVPRPDAVAGTLRPGERIDVAATYGSGIDTYSAYVVRGVPLLGVSSRDGGAVGDSSEISLTVAVTSMDDVLALGHAVHTASVFVARAATSADDAGATPGSYRPEPRTDAPVPGPAGNRSSEETAPPPAATAEPPSSGGTSAGGPEAGRG